MAKIKILGDGAKSKEMPKRVKTDKDMSQLQERFQPGGKHELTLDKSFRKSFNGKK